MIISVVTLEGIKTINDSDLVFLCFLLEIKLRKVFLYPLVSFNKIQILIQIQNSERDIDMHIQIQIPR